MLIVEDAERCRDVGLIRTVANSDPQSPRVRAPDPSRHHSCMIGARDDVSRFLKKESPRVGQILGELRRRKLNGELDGREAELEAAQELIA